MMHSSNKRRDSNSKTGLWAHVDYNVAVSEDHPGRFVGGRLRCSQFRLFPSRLISEFAANVFGMGRQRLRQIGLIISVIPIQARN